MDENIMDNCLILAAENYASYYSALEYSTTMPVATEESVAESESLLGFTLPELLRHCYLHVGNGGYGPAGACLIGVRDGFLYNSLTAPMDNTIHALYRSFRNYGSAAKAGCAFEFNDMVVSQWPEFLVPAFAWSSPTYLCVDFKSNDQAVYFFDTACINPWEPTRPIPLIKLFDSLEAFWLFEGNSGELWRTSVARLRARCQDLSS